MSERSSISSTKYGPSVCSGLTTQVVEAVSAAAPVVSVAVDAVVELPVVSLPEPGSPDFSEPPQPARVKAAAVDPMRPSISRRVR
jgi:hypothetical protein